MLKKAMNLLIWHTQILDCEWSYKDLNLSYCYVSQQLQITCINTVNIMAKGILIAAHFRWITKSTAPLTVLCGMQHRQDHKNPMLSCGYIPKSESMDPNKNQNRCLTIHK